MEKNKSTEYTYEIGQVASILANPAYTLDKILKYQQECLERIEFEEDHGVDTAHNVRSMRIYNACIALLKPQFTL
jgi:hypothetical protein